ncbi:MAG TPA: dihydrofolate reductase [Thermoanaerobaculia bacterium]|nr:dihydrofolate reductase [Thermoanaerobaculia bacterium]
MEVTLIAAVAANRVIGRGGGVPWHLPPDLRRFKRRTMGHWMLMGRRTWESIGRKPLPGRPTIVVTRDPRYTAEPAQVAGTVEEGLGIAEAAGEAELFVAGGAAIYRATLDRADRLDLTRLEREFDGDTYFPELDWARWRLVWEEAHAPAGTPPAAFRFELWERA